jgi:putative lipoic acid-binding regulatory protein
MTNEDTNNHTQSLLQFPCDFVIKIFGAASDEFEMQALTIIRHHIKDIREDAIKSRLSKDNKYLALTITLYVESREQLDVLYKELSANPQILMVL